MPAVAARRIARSQWPSRWCAWAFSSGSPRPTWKRPTTRRSRGCWRPRRSLATWCCSPPGGPSGPASSSRRSCRWWATRAPTTTTSSCTPRIWVLAEPKLPRADYDDFYRRFAPGRTAVGAESQLRQPAAAALRQRPRQAAALLGRSDAGAGAGLPRGARRPANALRWDGRVHRCPGGDVAEEWHEMLFAPRRCIRFYPPGGATKLVVELKVPAANELALDAGLHLGPRLLSPPGPHPGRRSASR